jgi:Spx/MgsR family transcriptional regulator
MRERATRLEAARANRQGIVDMIAMHGLERCDTCRKARAWLDQRGVPYRFNDYRDQPAEDRGLLAYARQLGWGRLVNRASRTWRDLPESARAPQSDADWLDLVRAHPTLIRRPLLVFPDGTASAGFSATRYASLFP